MDWWISFPIDRGAITLEGWKGEILRRVTAVNIGLPTKEFQRKLTLILKPKQLKVITDSFKAFVGVEGTAYT